MEGRKRVNKIILPDVPANTPKALTAPYPKKERTLIFNTPHYGRSHALLTLSFSGLITLAFSKINNVITLQKLILIDNWQALL